MKPWYNTPTCPRPLVAYDHDDESPTPPGVLRCTARGEYSGATAEQRAHKGALGFFNVMGSELPEAYQAAWRERGGSI